MADSNVVHLNAQNFDSEVLKSAVPVLVDFWAPWCGPCKMIAPVLDEIAAEQADQFKICKLNVDDNPELAQRYGIRAIPALLFFKGGEVQGQMVGLNSKQTIVEKLLKLV